MYRPFGKTGWNVAQIGLGCWQFGGPITLDGKPDGWTGTSDAEAIATVQRAVEHGVNFFDTADMYGWGHSEEALGIALKNCPRSIGGRDRVYIATKVGFWHDAEGRRIQVESRDAILKACDESLRRLQTDHIDLYQCHLWRTERHIEFLDAFDTLRRAGKIRFFGVSTNDFDMIRKFNQFKALAAVQANYNLLDRQVEKEIIPYCKANGIAFIARGVLAMGKLSGHYNKDTRFDERDIRSNWMDDANREQFERDMAMVERLKPVIKQIGFSMPLVVIKFVLNNPAVSVALVGCKNRSQLEQNFAAAVIPPLKPAEIHAIDRALKKA
jgi:aryl-alcohol dehydrogenase-like predicted oxidoreductase